MADDPPRAGQNGNSQENTGQNNNNGLGQNGTAVPRKNLKCTCEFPRIYTNDDSKKNGTVRKVMRTEFLKTSDGTEYTRPHVCGPNPNEWREAPQPVRPSTPQKNKSLWVVRQRQFGQDNHWSLFAAVDDNSVAPEGRVWQINGVPGEVMYWAHRHPKPGIKIFISATFMDKLLVCETLSEIDEARVEQIAHSIKPPGPSKLKRGNCKTWVWEVLDQLVKEGITTADVAAKARELEPFV
ncbi:hypothetical protein UCDDA912_g07850 [Diaporthe ampelina]|uniref:Uncharacterized protein n=1 Tax=Diaporthe ampelina TaxID=1214573 RepID=A0A0G2FDD4_9PEZI|nr:hypothetical protein UCDDA912_g07850 [Diaporthe ampelina]